MAFATTYGLSAKGAVYFSVEIGVDFKVSGHPKSDSLISLSLDRYERFIKQTVLFKDVAGRNIVKGNAIIQIEILHYQSNKYPSADMDESCNKRYLFKYIENTEFRVSHLDTLIATPKEIKIKAESQWGMLRSLGNLVSVVVLSR